MEPLTESEKVRRREYMRDSHAALKAGMSLEEFERARDPSPQAQRLFGHLDFALLQPSEVGADVEQRVTGFVGRMVWAHGVLERCDMRTLRQGAPVAVVFEVRERRRTREPWRERLYREADCGRGQDAVRPNHLGLSARCPVTLVLLCQALVGNEAAAPQARPTG
jgi:hypothetical protein